MVILKGDIYGKGILNIVTMLHGETSLEKWYFKSKPRKPLQQGGLNEELLQKTSKRGSDICWH
jgi:hypothetical protein